MPEYGPLRDDGEFGQFAEIISACFDIKPDDARAWLEKVPRPLARVLRAASPGSPGTPAPVAAGLLLVPMGQSFGGREVGMAGVAAVGVPPERRGKGEALRLCREAMRELHAAGTPISTLYPATVNLYRQAGFEIAGHRHRVRARPSGMPRRKDALPARRMTEADRPAVEALARRRALRSPGHLLRGEYIWRRIREPKDATPRGYVFEQEGRPTGFCWLVHVPGDKRPYTRLSLLDWATDTPQAADGLLAFLARHDSLVDSVQWFGAPHDPLVARLRERRYEVALEDPWMLRITHVQAALAARGWPAASVEPLVLRVSDDAVPGNAGAWRLELRAGELDLRAAKPGEGPELSCTINGLAPLYTGCLDARTLAVAGLVSGGDDALARADALFAGAAPSMADMF